MTNWITNQLDVVYTTNKFVVQRDMCIDGHAHCVRWETPKATAGHPRDKDEVCIKCGKVLANVRWNGTFLVREFPR